MTVGIAVGKMLARKKTCISFVRITSLTIRSLVPSSPFSLASLAALRDWTEYLFMGVEQPRDLRRHRFATLWRTRDRTRLGHVMRRRQRDTAECNDAFGQPVH